jgi:hypothetical protein
MMMFDALPGEHLELLMLEERSLEAARKESIQQGSSSSSADYNKVLLVNAAQGGSRHFWSPCSTGSTI